MWADIASLLPGVAAIISAVFGGVIGLRALGKGSPKEREDAAREAVARILNTDSDEMLPDRDAAIGDIAKAIHDRRKGHDRDQ